MKRPFAGVSLMPSEDFRVASGALFERGAVEALEWNVDMGWGRELPEWATALLDRFSDEGRLYAHGVEFSLLSAELHDRQAWWLDRLREECKARRFVHVTEHFGFMTAGAFVHGTPLPHPRTPAAVTLGVDRLKRLADAAGRPVGLENLAIAFGARDVAEQPGFVAEMIDSTDGFLLLDLHNVHCQSLNFGVPARELVARWPLDRVREIHVAGGSWSHPKADPEGRPFRRDSHDDGVPIEVLDLLEHTLPLCPSIDVVILERSDHSLYGADDISRFERDFRDVRAIVERSRA